MNESLSPIRNPIVTEAQLALVRINEDLSKTQQSALRNLVYEYRDIFVFNDELGCLNCNIHHTPPMSVCHIYSLCRML
jgi:hypothetical protein